ncbi:hypothetical protein PFISCL1PPCAC_22314, partial [Pristionchus fissidentatus]
MIISKGALYIIFTQSHYCLFLRPPTSSIVNTRHANDRSLFEIDLTPDLVSSLRICLTSRSDLFHIDPLALFSVSSSQIEEFNRDGLVDFDGKTVEFSVEEALPYDDKSTSSNSLTQHIRSHLSCSTLAHEATRSLALWNMSG